MTGTVIYVASLDSVDVNWSYSPAGGKLRGYSIGEKTPHRDTVALFVLPQEDAVASTSSQRSLDEHE